MQASTLTIDGVRQALQTRHGFGDETPEQTLNRLWIRHVGAQRSIFGDAFADEAPRMLTDRNVAMTIEHWSTVGLSALFPKDSTSGDPRDESAPPVIVRFRVRSCLIDGRRRVAKWQRERSPDIHSVHVLSVTE